MGKILHSLFVVVKKKPQQVKGLSMLPVSFSHLRPDPFLKNHYPAQLRAGDNVFACPQKNAEMPLVSADRSVL
jgi:hypothetical protein